jgi:hypothetical protein
MKLRSNKDLIVLIVLTSLFLFGAFVISNDIEDNHPPYTIDNKSEMGISVFYHTLRELNYPVKRTQETLESHDLSTIQVAAENYNFNINEDKIKQWVQRGGIIVYLSPRSFHGLEYDYVDEQYPDMMIYKFQLGKVIWVNADYITNSVLAQDTSTAYRLLQEIDKNPYEKIYFNQSHFITFDDGKKSLWGLIPMDIKFILYQMILVIIAFFYYKGRIFGKPIPLYDEVERTENEYLYSVSSLYRQAKCWDLMLESYYKSLLRQLRHSHETWLDYWENQGLPHLDKAQRVHKFMEQLKGRISAKESFQIIISIEQLKNSLKKRSDIYWKTLK